MMLHLHFFLPSTKNNIGLVSVRGLVGQLMTIGTIVTMSKSYYIVTYETLIVKSPLIVQQTYSRGENARVTVS